MSGPRIGELFAGYGGLGAGVQSVYGGEIAWVSDIDKGANKILAHRFPGVPNHGDITTIDWSTVEPVDILTGGSPCQDLSHAGRRAGMTEGTRSNLWVAMREAIAQLRPSLVVWENVRGAYSAAADSEVEPCAGCVGDGSGVHLRALGRVLGDLSELGYDARWHGLRAADVGAPHGRFRVFVVATDATQQGRAGRGPRSWAATDGGVLHEQSEHRHNPDVLLPTPTSSDAHGAGEHGAGGLDLRTTVALLPTPMANEAEKAGQTTRTDGGQQYLTHAVHALLPTPAVNDMGEGKTVERWDEWTADMQAKHGNGNGHGKSLAIEAQRLLPTPTAADSAASGGSTPHDITLTDAIVRTNLGEKENPRHAVSTEGRPGEGLRDVRNAADSQEVCEREAGGSKCLSAEASLLVELREHEGCGDEGRAALASQEAQGERLPGLRNDEASARSPRGPEPGEQRPGEPDDALRELSPEAALAGGPGRVDWGAYTDAIRRWESVLGRPAPPPTTLSKKGNPQLCPEFVTWLMGLPEGWVTDVPGITRNEALKALGNGVVSQQCAAALRLMASWEVAA